MWVWTSTVQIWEPFTAECITGKKVWNHGGVCGTVCSAPPPPCLCTHMHILCLCCSCLSRIILMQGCDLKQQYYVTLSIGDVYRDLSLLCKCSCLSGTQRLETVSNSMFHGYLDLFFKKNKNKKPKHKLRLQRHRSKREWMRFPPWMRLKTLKS